MMMIKRIRMDLVSRVLRCGWACSGDENADTRIPLAVVDPEPESRLNKMLLSRLDSSDTIKTVHLSEVDAIESLRKGEVAGVLVIPLGFSEQAESPKAKR